MSKAPIGSKANPSEFDVIEKLAEDEPYFVIRAHDPLSSALVELHAYIGAGQAGAAHNKLAEIMARKDFKPPTKKATSAELRKKEKECRKLQQVRGGDIPVTPVLCLMILILENSSLAGPG